MSTEIRNGVSMAYIDSLRAEVDDLVAYRRQHQTHAQQSLTELGGIDPFSTEFDRAGRLWLAYARGLAVIERTRAQEDKAKAEVQAALRQYNAPPAQ